MNGNILTQTSWRVKSVFTLTVLFATTCLLLTNLSAEHDYDSHEEYGLGVWGEAYVSTWYDGTFARSYHSAYLVNETNDAFQYYYEFDAKLLADEENVLDEDNTDGEGAIQMDDWEIEVENFSFRKTTAGDYTIEAFTDLDIKDFNDHLRTYEWHASCSTTFMIDNPEQE